MEKQTPIKPLISSSLLKQIDIRVGTIIHVEGISGSDKLAQLFVDFGDHKRNIIVGLKKERSNLKEIEGLQTLFVVNLEPRILMGKTSEGMLFDLGYEDGITPVLAVPEHPVPNGTRAG